MVDVTAEGKKLIYTFISLFIVFVMVFVHEYHVETKINKSRGFIASIFMGILGILFITFIILFLIRFKFGFNFFHLDDTFFHDDNIIHFTNIFRVVSFFFGITILILAFTVKNPNTLQYAKHDKWKEIIYGFVIIIYNSLEILYSNKEVIGETWKFLLLTTVISAIYIGSILGVTNLKKKYKDFFNKDSYGYLCLGKKFEDISLKHQLICPTNKLQ